MASKASATRRRRRPPPAFAPCSTSLSTFPQSPSTCTFRQQLFHVFPVLSPTGFSHARYTNVERRASFQQAPWKLDGRRESVSAQRESFASQPRTKTVEDIASHSSRVSKVEIPSEKMHHASKKNEEVSERHSHRLRKESADKNHKVNPSRAVTTKFAPGTIAVGSNRTVRGRRKTHSGQGDTLGRANILGPATVLIRGSDREVIEFLDSLRRGERKMTVEQFNEAASTLSRQKRLRDALSLVHIWEHKPLATELVKYKSVKSYTIMIDVYGKSHQLSRAFSLFYGMPRLGVEPNTITYNAMIAACARSNEPDLAYGVFEEMKERGLVPDKFTYGALIDSCAKCGQVDRAFQISATMDEAGVKKDQTIYSALMDACGRAKQLDRAFSVFEAMKRHEVWPNQVTFSVLIDICANAREPTKALFLFSEMKHWGFPKANVVVYTALIDACSKAGWPERAELVMKSMIKNGIRPNEISFGALLEGWTRAGDLDQAFGILDRMVNDHGVMPNAVLIGGLIDACKKLGETCQAKRVWAMVVKFNILPSRTYYPALMTMAAHCGDINVASAIALHAYARGTLRRVALNSEDPTLHALACAVAYLRHAIERSTASPLTKKQQLDRLKVVFNSTAMRPAQMNSISPEAAYECCTSWNVVETRPITASRNRKHTMRDRSVTARRAAARVSAASTTARLS